MKYAYLIKSNYVATETQSGQGNILGVFSSFAGAMTHFNRILDDRSARRGCKIAWVQSYTKKDRMHGKWMDERMHAFYVTGKWPEIVELMQFRVIKEKRK